MKALAMFVAVLGLFLCVGAGTTACGPLEKATEDAAGQPADGDRDPPCVDVCADSGDAREPGTDGIDTGQDGTPADGTGGPDVPVQPPRWKACAADAECPDGIGCLEGFCRFCIPGTKQCDGTFAAICNEQGAGWAKILDCDEDGNACFEGNCIAPCEAASRWNGNAGCDFFAVDLDNAYEEAFDGAVYDAQHAQFAIIASNTSEKHTATVTLHLPDGTQETKDAAPMSLVKFEPPATWSVDGTEKVHKAFRISANRPITVYQFNPLSNEEEVFSNDASVLLPACSLGTTYRVMSYGIAYGGIDYRSFLAVVGVGEVPATVTVTVSASTTAGEGIPALVDGVPFTTTLSQGEVLNLETDAAGDRDLTGSLIEADGVVAVFGGHEATNMIDLCCADHLEEQLMPLKAWGTHYLVAPSWPRWKEKDYVRILAGSDNTTVTVIPAVAGLPLLDAGEHFTFPTSEAMQISADKPISVAQYLASSFEILGLPMPDNCLTNADCPDEYECDPFGSGLCLGPDCAIDEHCPPGHTCEEYVDPSPMSACEPIGDPSMMMAVPEVQFRDAYVFLTPDAYLQDYVTVVAPLDVGWIELDNVKMPLAEMLPVGGSGFGFLRAPLEDGVHVIRSDRKLGITVYGYDNDVSYGYPGGMGLEQIAE